MARIRSIKPEIWEDELFGNLSVDEQLLFIGLISHSDDEGRLRGAPERVRAAVWPYREVSAAAIDEWLESLAGAALIVRYVVDRQSYIQVRGWSKHQRVDKPKPSRFPAPPDAENLRADAGNIPAVAQNPTETASASGAGNNPDASTTDKDQGSRIKEEDLRVSRGRARPAEIFDELVDLWPKRLYAGHRGEVQERWMALGPPDLELAEKILEHARRECDERGWEPGDVNHHTCPQLAAWLHGRSWESATKLKVAPAGSTADLAAQLMGSGAAA